MTSKDTLIELIDKLTADQIDDAKIALTNIIQGKTMIYKINNPDAIMLLCEALLMDEQIKN